jgi:hypothetical protein
MKLLRNDQEWHVAGFRMWSSRARVVYSAALLCLLAALTILAVPAGSHRYIPALRWLAVAAGAAAFIAEALWILASFTDTKWGSRLLLPRP